MKQLSYLIVEQILPGKSCPGHTILKVVWFLLDNQSEDSLKCFQRLSSGESQGFLLESRILDILAGCQGGLGELTLEQVSGPLESVLNGVGEIFQCADGDGFLWRILR